MSQKSAISGLPRIQYFGNHVPYKYSGGKNPRDEIVGTVENIFAIKLIVCKKGFHENLFVIHG
jgi:hypothetical protein